LLLGYTHIAIAASIVLLNLGVAFNLAGAVLLAIGVTSIKRAHRTHARPFLVIEAWGRGSPFD
jgi:hypothetical protein